MTVDAAEIDFSGICASRLRSNCRNQEMAENREFECSAGWRPPTAAILLHKVEPLH
jgi:hypothetical protein